MIRLVLTSVLFLMILTSTAASQFVYNFTGTGARAHGMGDAFIAVSDDASAASWNPAGLTVHDKLLIGFDLDNFAPDNEYINGSNHFLRSPSFSSIGQLSIIAPFRFRGRPLVFAFSYSRVTEEFWSDGVIIDMIYENTIFGAVRDTSNLVIRAESWQHPDLAILNFALGTKVSPRVSVGFSTNIYLGSNIQNLKQETRFDYYMDASTDPQHVLREQTVLILDTTSYSGVNFTISTKYDGDAVDFGLVIKTPFDLSAETDRKLFSEVYHNGLLQNNGTGVLYIDNQLVKTEIPWSIGLGIAVTPIENLLISGDVEYSAYNGSLVKQRDSLHIIPGSNNEEFFTTFDFDWNNSMRLRFGTEYQWHTSFDLLPIIPIRFGFSSVAVPLNKLSLGNEIANVIGATGVEKTSQTNVSFGLGVKWTQVFLDASLTFISTELPVSGKAQTYKSDGTTMSFGFTGYF